MLYTGNFKTKNNETIEVKITTNDYSSQEVELTFVDESPVIITQESSDGIFSPIKSRGCTITIVAKEPYFNLYSGESHGTKVEVNNLSKGECLFYGYLTPCEYNQSLLYLNEIELEAVDAISTLQDFKYKYQNNYNSQLVSISSVLKYCISNIAGYTGGIYLPKYGLISKRGKNLNLAPTEIEYISEEAFVDDDEDDTMSCYEVLEEICNFYNMSLVPYGNDVYFIDYELIAKYDENHSWYPQSDYGVFKNIKNFNEVEKYIPLEIKKENYCGDDQNIEIDEVYNKVSIKAETEEVEEKDLLYDPIDDINGSTYYNTITGGMNRSDGVHWTHVTRLFEFIKGSYGGWVDSNGDWQTLCNTNSEFASFSYKLTDNFTNTENSNIYGWMNFPYTSGYLFNHIVGQTCMPAQQFGYESTKEMPYNSNWSDVLLFFPQVQWINEYYQQNGGFIVPKNYTNVWECWWDFYENHLGGSKPVLIYSGKKDIQFSPTDSSKTNYLAFTGDLLFQQNCTYDHVNYHLWSVDKNDGHKYYGGTLFPIKDAGAHDTHNAYYQESSAAGYNKGWNTLKIKLSIGDRYWNGTSWQFGECTAWIPYHKSNVVSEPETLVWSDYNKPVTNHNYTYRIGKDAYVIPINKSDGLHGKIKFQVYMPVIPYSTGLFYTIDDNKFWNGDWPISQGQKIDLINYEHTPPVIFMKNLSLELISADNDTEHWYRDFSDLEDEDDDIIYSNSINSQYVKEFDDLTLKINTYNKKEPISHSYIIDPTQYDYYSNIYYIASRDYFNGSAGVIKDNNNILQGYMYNITLNDFNGYSINHIQAWFAGKQNQGYFTDEFRGVPVKIQAGEYVTDGWLYQNFDGSSTPIIQLRIGQIYSTYEEAINDPTGVQFYNNLNGELIFLAPDSNYPPLNLYPNNLRRGEKDVNITYIRKSEYQSEGFYRIHKNTTIQEELNVVNRYVEHYQRPKKIYNCEVHGYYEPWKCIMPKALDYLKMVVDEQEYDVKADANELKIIEY